jgi:signal transduction histidine kinase
MPDERTEAGGLTSVLWTALLTIVSGGITFLIANALYQPQAISIIFSILLGGIALLVRFLVGFEKRQASVEIKLGEYAFDALRIARQREDEIRQSALTVRYIEERLPQIIADMLHLKQHEEPIVRELAHSLGTPLAQMEAILISRPTRPETAREDADLMAGIQVCKTFLAAFRGLATLAQDTYAWEPESIGDAVLAAARLYVARAGADVVCDVALPDVLPGYGKNYIVGIVLPLLENAIEASPAAGKVSVEAGETETANTIVVANFLRPGETVSPSIYDESWTSKPGHEGLGLATVNKLLSVRSGATLTHRLDGAARVVFTIQLPRRTG